MFRRLGLISAPFQLITRPIELSLYEPTEFMLLRPMYHDLVCFQQPVPLSMSLRSRHHGLLANRMLQDMSIQRPIVDLTLREHGSPVWRYGTSI